MKRALLEALLKARRERRAVALVTDLDTGAQRLVARADSAADPLGARLAEAFRFDQSGTADRQFINIHNPPLRLVIIGAVHIAQAVIPMALQLGYDVTVIDPHVKWRIDVNETKSKSRNTPFHGWPVIGRAAATIVNGDVKMTRLG